MTPHQILRKAIDKALENGLNIDIDDAKNLISYHPYELIYRHDFAKALWGEETFILYHSHDCHINDKDYVDDMPYPNTYQQRFKHYRKDYTCRRCKKYRKMQHTISNTNCLPVEGTKDNQGWQYHLQRMVVADDPTKYLGENI